MSIFEHFLSSKELQFTTTNDSDMLFHAIYVIALKHGR